MLSFALSHIPQIESSTHLMRSICEFSFVLMYVDVSVFELLVCVDHRIKLSAVRHGFSEDKEAFGSLSSETFLTAAFKTPSKNSELNPKMFQLQAV